MNYNNLYNFFYHFWATKATTKVPIAEIVAHFLSLVPNHTAPESKAVAVTDNAIFFQIGVY